MKFAAIADWAASDGFPVTFMCEQLDVSTSEYHKWRSAETSEHDRHDVILQGLIKTFHNHLLGNPGVRRIHAQLAAAGHCVSHKRVWRLMRALGLQGRHPTPWRATTIAGPHPVGAPDLIGRDFTSAAPNEKWCGDITYVKTWNGWAYLATVIDLHSRAVVGWAIADHMRTSLVIEALQMAITHRRPKAGVIFASDRGAQYTSGEFARFCKKNKVRRSMGRVATCFDNAVAESFFATYKKELIHTRPWPSLESLKKETFTWITTYYNRTRRHSTLNYLTPEEYELGYRNVNELAA